MSTIITKYNSTAGVAPSAGQLVVGELAVNVTDKKLYTLDAGNNVVLISSGSDYSVPVTIDVSSSSAALRVTQRGSGNALLIEDTTNPDSTPFAIDANGAVAIGATTAAALAISGTPQLSQGGIIAAASRNAFSRWDAGSTGFAMQFGKSRSGAVGTQGIVSSGDSAGQLQFFGDDGTSFIQLATINAAVDGTPGTNDMPGRLVFSTTADGAATPTERLRITSTGALAIAGASNYGSAGQALISAGNASPVWTDQFLSITYVFSNPASGDQGDLTIPFACTITEWTLLADVSGSIVVDIWKDTYANYPPTVADTITGSAKPTITAATKGQSSTLTGWTTTISAGDTLRFNVDSVTTIARITLSLKVKRT
jgi:hypothetical protein